MATLTRYVDFGAEYAGIPTVGYRVLADVGTVLVARSTSGVVNVAGGLYRATFDVVDDVPGVVYWDTVADGPVYASEPLYPAAGASLSPGGLDGIEVEDGVNMRQAMSLCLAALAGVLSGVGNPDGVVTVQAAGSPGTTRIVYVTTPTGNRLAITLLPPA